MTNTYVGANKKKRDERETKKQNGLQKFVAQIQGVQQKFINDWAKKHDSLVNIVNTTVHAITERIGVLYGNQQRLVGSMERIDINILALSELNKLLYKRLTHQLGVVGTVAEMEEKALAIYQEDMKTAFTTVYARREKEDEEHKAAEEKAKADAKAAEEAKTEAERIEKALLEAERELVVDATTSGGKGVEIPEGAQVFGG